MAAIAGVAIGLGVGAWPLGSPTTAPARIFVVPGITVATAAVAAPLAAQLVLPPGTAGVDLAAIPDRFLNDPPAARLRDRVQVRSTSGLASVDAPFEIAWSESGYFYWLRSSTLSIAQLVDVAGALR